MAENSAQCRPRGIVVSAKVHHNTSSKNDSIWQRSDAVWAFSEILIFTHEIDKAYKLKIAISQIWSLGNILAKRFLDEIIPDLFFCAHTERKTQKI